MAAESAAESSLSEDVGDLFIFQLDDIDALLIELEDDVEAENEFFEAVENVSIVISAFMASFPNTLLTWKLCFSLPGYERFWD